VVENPEGYAADAPYRRVWSVVDAVIDRVGADGNREAIQTTFRTLCGESLRRAPRVGHGRSSVITRAGVPFEFSFTTADRPGTFRMLTECAPADWLLLERVRATIRALKNLDTVCGLRMPWQKSAELLGSLIPESLDALDADWHNGALWVSMRFADKALPVMRLYVNQQINNNAYRFEKVDAMLDLLGQDWNRELLWDLFQLIGQWSDLAGLSLDFSAGQIGGVKLYFGAFAAEMRDIAALAAAAGAEDRLAEIKLFLEAAKAVDQETSRPALLASVLLPDHKGPLQAVKFDVTTAAVFERDRDVYRLMTGLLRAFRLHPYGFRACEDLFASPRWDVPPVRSLQYVGLALGRRGTSTMNIYLAPPESEYSASLEPDVASTPYADAGRRRARAFRERAAEALRRAAEYLASTQSLDGGWWDLPVSIGSSGPWLTALVGKALINADQADSNVDAGTVVERAAQFIEQSELQEGGWGWNEALPADCDSTAHCVLFLSDVGRETRPGTLAALLAFQAADGGFRTYQNAPPGHSWGLLHHDVHPAAVRAVAAARTPQDDAVTRGLPIIQDGLADEPIWPAFWWTTTAYGPWANLLCLADLGMLDMVTVEHRSWIRRSIVLDQPLDAALACTIAGLLHDRALERSAAEFLIDSQLCSGGWPGSRALRVVEAACMAPWLEASEDVAGLVYREHRGILTTAFGLAALVTIVNRGR